MAPEAAHALPAASAAAPSGGVSSPGAASPGAASPGVSSPGVRPPGGASVEASATTLTSAEVAFVRQLVATAPTSGAARLRGLLLRRDVPAKEATTVLADALREVPFTDARASLLRDALATSPSVGVRSAFAPVAARAILARADAVLRSHVEDLDARPEALAELSRMYTFIEGELAAPKRLRGLAGDASTLNEDAFAACASALAAHLGNHPRLALGAKVSEGFSRLRARAAVALLELVGEGPASRAEASRLFGLSGARAAILSDLGVLALDDGAAGEARLAKLRGILERLPGSRAGVDAMVFGEERVPFPARLGLAALRTSLEAKGPSRGVLAWHEDVDPGPIDDSLADLTLELAGRTVQRAFEVRADLKAQSERDTTNAAGDPRRVLGRPLDTSAHATLAAAVALLSVDAPRVMDLAAVRFATHRTETIALVADAIGVLAAVTPARGVESHPVLVGRPKADGTEVVPLRVLRSDAAGAVASFELAGVRWEIERGPSGVVRGLARNGQPVRFSIASSSHIPVSDAFAWKSEGLVFARVLGAPHAGTGGSKFRLVGAGAGGVDAVATPAPSADVEVDAVMSVANEEGGVALRASAEETALRGVSVVITPGAPARASLVLTEGTAARPLTPSVALPAGDTVPLHVVVRGQKVQARVAGQTLESFFPPSIDGNAVALYAKRGAVVEVGGFRVVRAR